MIERTVDARLDIIRNGVKAGEIYAVEAPHVRMDATALIKTALTVSVKKSQDFEPLTDEIRPVLIIDGQEHSCGVYLPATVTETLSSGNSICSIEAYDRSWRVETTLWLPGQKLAAGTNYLDAVETLLLTAGISLVSRTPTAAVLAADRTFDAGTSLILIVNQLLAEINYNELWFDSDGYARLEPFAPATADQIDFVLDANDVHSLLLPELAEELDIFSAPNVFVCVVSSPERDEALVATAENNNPGSLLSIPRRGRRIQSFVKVDEIAGQTELDAFAQRLCWESMAFGETVTISTGILPGWGVDDVIALQYGDYSGIFQSTAWEMDLAAGGTMTHTLKRVVISI